MCGVRIDRVLWSNPKDAAGMDTPTSTAIRDSDRGATPKPGCKTAAMNARVICHLVSLSPSYPAFSFSVQKAYRPLLVEEQ
jgi:hypothetical protein